ncbi:serine hydrolase domain-containing protein [Bacteroidota bacterium]
MIIARINKIVSFLLIIIIFSGCLKNEELNLEFNSYEPVNINDGLFISNPDIENINSSMLTNIYNDIYDDDNLWSMRSLLVFKNGKLVSEAYFKDEQDITNRHIIWSCTKQVIGVLTGIALDKGLINNINDPISDYFDTELTNHPDKGNISIKNLLTMQSGIDYDNGVQTDEILRRIPGSSVDLILDQQMNFPPGTEFHYNDGNPHLMSALIQKVTNKATDEWADEILFSKLELTNYNWVRYMDGITLGGFGIETSPRELSKIALCVADGGRWKGQQVVSENWINEMVSPQIQIDDFEYSFGYFWWVDEARDIFFMWGVGGQFAFIVPAKRLLVVMTAFPNTKGEYEIQADEALLIVDRIIDASF